jgi:hypothetical protein
MLVTNFLCFPPVAICCTICQVNVSEFGPGDTLHVDVDLTKVHTLVRFCVRPLKHMTLSACHKKYKKELTCALYTYQSLLYHQLCIEVNDCTFEHLLETGTNYNYL